MFKKILALSLALSLALATPVLANEVRFEVDSATFTVDGVAQQIVDGVSPFIDAEYSRTMLPLTAVAEALGATVGWNAETRTASITRGNIALSVPVDEPLPGGMGNPVIVDGRVFVPLAYVADELGATTRWDAQARAVYITETAPPEVLYLPPAPTAEEYEYAFARLGVANDILLDAGSFVMQSVTDMQIDIENMTTLNTVMYGETATIIHSETEFSVRSEMSMSILGETNVRVQYIRDGAMYMGVDSEWIRMDMGMDMGDLLAQTGLITFEEEAIISQTAREDGNNLILTFTLVGEAMENMMNAMLSSTGREELDGAEMQISEIIMVFTIDADGNLLSIDMLMDATTEILGLQVTMSMDMRSEIVQVGGVEIDFPAELDEVE